MGVQLAGADPRRFGHGSIGARVAALGRAFDMTVLVHAPSKTVAEPGIHQTSMDELLAASDFVVLLAVTTEEMRHLKPTAYFVETSSSASGARGGAGSLSRKERGPSSAFLARSGLAFFWPLATR